MRPQPHGDAPPQAGDDDPPLPDSEERFLRRALGSAGLDREKYRSRPLQRRLHACLRALRAETVDEAARRLERDPGLLTRAVSTLVIGVTEFFRDGPVFEAIERVVLPRLLEQRGRISAWSAACSDGPELYSIAMLLGERGWLGQARLLGTDCRADAVATAGEGVYRDLAVKGLDAQRLKRWFTPLGGGWRIAGALRDSCTWKAADVFAAEEEQAWDLVLCRNLAIYLEPAWALRLWSRLEKALRPGGVLVAGRAERPVGAFRRIGPCLYQRGEE